MAALEAAALDGSLFDPHRSPSPARSLDTASNPNTDDELGSDLDPSPNPQRGDGANGGAAVGGGAQTGPKGVLSDKKAYARAVRYAELQAKVNTIALQEKRKIIASTSTEEDGLREQERLIASQREQQDEDEEERVRERYRQNRRREIEQQQQKIIGNRDKRGGLREIGHEGFLSAVERPGWVVILIYEPDIPRCNALLASTLSLSLSSSLPITILRARATSLSFSLLPGHPEDEPRADPDVLPTLLAYKEGELNRTWIRVDWEVKEDGVEGLLRREGILPDLNRPRFGERNRVGGQDEDE